MYHLLYCLSMDCLFHHNMQRCHIRARINSNNLILYCSINLNSLPLIKIDATFQRGEQGERIIIKYHFHILSIAASPFLRAITAPYIFSRQFLIELEIHLWPWDKHRLAKWSYVYSWELKLISNSTKKNNLIACNYGIVGSDKFRKL